MQYHKTEKNSCNDRESNPGLPGRGRRLTPRDHRGHPKVYITINYINAIVLCSIDDLSVENEYVRGSVKV